MAHKQKIQAHFVISGTTMRACQVKVLAALGRPGGPARIGKSGKAWQLWRGLAAASVLKGKCVMAFQGASRVLRGVLRGRPCFKG